MYIEANTCTAKMAHSLATPKFGMTATVRPCTSARSSRFMAGGAQHRLPNGAGNRGRVMMAVSRETKEKTVAMVKEELEQSLLLTCLDPSGVEVKDMQKLRRAMPESTKVAMAKNRLVWRACMEDDEAKWESMKPLMTGSNLWFFVREEEVAGTMKAMKSFLKENEELKEKLVFKGGCLDGSFVKPEDMEKLEKMPTKLDILTKIGVGVKAVPTKLGRGVKAVPLKLGRTMAALRDKIEEEENGGKSRFDE